MTTNPKFLQYVEDHQQDYIDRLRQAVEIPSYVSPLGLHIDLANLTQRLWKPRVCIYIVIELGQQH